MVVVHSPEQRFRNLEFAATVAGAGRILRADEAATRVVGPSRGASVAPDGHTAVIQAGAARDS